MNAHNSILSLPTLSTAEQIVFDAIALQPFASQAILAETCAMSRPAIAGHVRQLTRKGYLVGRAYILADRTRILCIGGAAIDRKYSLYQQLVSDTSNPAEGKTNFGGVARNVAENLTRLNMPSSLLSALGDDEAGRAIEADLRAIGVDTTGIFIVPNGNTADYIALISPDGKLDYGIVSDNIWNEITPEHIIQFRSRICASRIVFADCNLPIDTIKMIANIRKEIGFLFAVDTTSVTKSLHVQHVLNHVDILFCNQLEADHLLGITHATPELAIESILDTGVSAVIMTCGANGLWYAETGNTPRHLPALANLVHDVTGAGDALIAATLGSLAQGLPLDQACLNGLAAAAIVTESPSSTCPSNIDLLIANRLSTSEQRSA